MRGTEIDRHGRGDLPHCIIVKTSEKPFSLMLISMRFSPENYD